MNLFESASCLALRYLSRERFLAWRTRYYSTRAALHPLMRVVYGTFDAAAMRKHLEDCIGMDFEILMVHSSMNHMKPMYSNTPLDLVRMLMEFCGPDRTLVMPAFCFLDPAIGAADATFAQHSRFDLRRTPSRMGLVTELFRRTKGVCQSRHPVYRVSAFGPLAKQLIHGHEWASSPCGRGTPFDFMANHNTQIVGIGKRYDVLTQVHHAEDLMGDDFPVPAKRGKGLTMTLVDGKEEILIELPGRSLAWRRNMWKLRDIMDRDSLQEWTFHHVPMFTTRAGEVTAALIDAAKHGVTLYEKP